MFETHCWSTDNERGVATGWLQGSLSARGRNEAHGLGSRRLAGVVDSVFTSDLRRAVATSEIAFAETAVPIHRDWRLRECNYGDLNGAPVSDIEARRRHHVDVPFPGGESYRQVVDRVGAFLDELVTQWDGRHVVLIGHTATRWSLDHLLTGIPLEDLVVAPFDWQPGWSYTLSAATLR